MNTIKVLLSNLESTPLRIGRVGENLHTQVRVNCMGVFADYPQATVSMTIQPPDGVSYPGTVQRDGVVITWNVTASDLAKAGSGQIQLTFTNGQEVIKTVIASTVILTSLEPTGEAPEPVQNWIDQANNVLADLESFDDLSASATQLPSGSPATAEITTVDGHKNIALGIPAGDSGEMVVETVTGSTPTITGVSNHRYICGTVSTISITPPESGIIDVVFTSGTTAAVLTIPNTVTFPEWFNPAALQTNTTYELNIADGMGVVAVWA
jgi:hypothetical protein